MKHIHRRTGIALALAIAGVFAMAPVMAEKPAHAGKGHADKSERRDAHDDKGASRDTTRSARDTGRFDDRHRTLASNFYGEQYRAGRCPPGLAKKHNGCTPPGQAKQWNVGQPLPRNVTYYQVPATLVTRFGTPPAGYRYIRVESDILMMAIATRMVVDSIQNPGRS